MALRVLLADNSETIKKVIQLTLQDYAAEVRSVNVGLDVVEVAKSYNPDVIFADILLQKRNGYDVCADLKASPELSKVPVVLMWSGFMDLDQAKAKQVRADATLEKPFDSNDLRELIQRLVPRLGSQLLSQFVEMPAFRKEDVKLEPPSAEALAAAIPTPAATTPPPIATPPSSSPADWNMESFDDIGDFQINEPKSELPDFPASNDSQEDFKQVPINEVSLKTPKQEAKMSKDNPFELDVPDETDFDGVTVNIPVPEEVTGTDFLLKPEQIEALKKIASETPAAAPAKQEKAAPKRELAKEPRQETPKTATVAATASPQLSEAQLEAVLRNHSQEIIEKIVWKLIPDMAERIIRDEIKRLLDEPDTKA